MSTISPASSDQLTEFTMRRNVPFGWCAGGIVIPQELAELKEQFLQQEPVIKHLLEGVRDFHPRVASGADQDRENRSLKDLGFEPGQYVQFFSRVDLAKFDILAKNASNPDDRAKAAALAERFRLYDRNSGSAVDLGLIYQTGLKLAKHQQTGALQQTLVIVVAPTKPECPQRNEIKAAVSKAAQEIYAHLNSNGFAIASAIVAENLKAHREEHVLPALRAGVKSISLPQVRA